MPRPRAVVPEPDRFFAENLAAVRKAKGWSLARLEAMSGVPAIAVYKSESRGRRVTVGEAVALCRALDVGLQEMATSKVSVTVETTMTLSPR